MEVVGAARMEGLAERAGRPVVLGAWAAGRAREGLGLAAAVATEEASCQGTR